MKKKLFALAVSVAMLATMLIMPATQASAAQAQVIKPSWFDESQKTNWWATDKYAGDSWRHSMSTANGEWKFTINSMYCDSGIATSYGDGYCVDLDVTPYLNYTVSSDANTTFRLRIYELSNETGTTTGNEHLIDVSAISASKNDKYVMSIDLTKNAEITALANSDNQIFVSGLQFTTSSFYDNSSIIFSNFEFSSAYDNYSYTPNWLDSSNQGAYWDYNSWGNAGGWYITNPDSKTWQYEYKWGVQDGSALLDSNTKGKAININEFYLLNVDLILSKPIELMLKIGGGEVSLGRFESGTTNASIDLRSVADLQSKIDENGNFTPDGICFKTIGFGGGDTVKMKNFKFTSTPVIASLTADAQGEKIAKADAAAVISLKANSTISGTEAVPAYQWYVDDVAVGGANSESYNINNNVLGHHTVYCTTTITVGTGYLLKDIVTKTEVTSYGAYILGDSDYDGQINATDLATTRQSVINDTTDALNIAANDVNGDGTLSVMDLVRLKRYIADPGNVVLGK